MRDGIAIHHNCRSRSFPWGRRESQKGTEKNDFTSLLDDSGDKNSSQSDMEAILVNFYKNLFAKDSLDMQIQTELIEDLDFSLTDGERMLCEGLFITGELFSALKRLKTRKSPGSDRLPTEFYLAFWNELGDILTLVLYEPFSPGFLNIHSARKPSPIII